MKADSADIRRHFLKALGALLAHSAFASPVNTATSVGRNNQVDGLAGYTLDNFTTLLTDLRAQILNQAATALETTSYGQLYEIRAQLVGPSGRTLRVRTIWMTEYLSGATKFITLIPD